MPIDKNSAGFLVITAAIGIAFFAIMLAVQPPEMTQRFLLGQNDFATTYCTVVLNGTPDLYSRPANRRVLLEILGLDSPALSSPSRPPYHSFLLRPLAYLPYRTAYFTYEAINFLAFIVFLWMFVPESRPLATFASLSVPVFANFINGQDVTLCLMFAGLSIMLARRNLDFWAGLALSLCAIKFHLFALIPLIVIIHRRWSILFGGAVGGAILIASCFLRQGVHWLQAYLGELRDPDLHPSPAIMPNIHSLSAFTSGPFETALELVLCAAVVASVIYLARKTADYELAFAYAMIGGLLVSFHAYIADCLLLLLPMTILLRKPVLKSIRDLSELVVSPIPYFLLLVGSPVNFVMPLLLAILGLATTARETDKQAGSSRPAAAAIVG